MLGVGIGPRAAQRLLALGLTAGNGPCRSKVGPVTHVAQKHDLISMYTKI